MKRMKQMVMLAAGLLALALIATFVAPKVGAAVKAALVEVVIPSHPYWGEAYIDTLAFEKMRILGPGTGTLGITSITITNLSDTSNIVYVQGVTTFDPGCQAQVTSAGQQEFRFQSPANTTAHYAFPAPVVIGSCYRVSTSLATQPGVLAEIVGIVN